MILKLSIVGLFIVLVVVLTITYYTQLEGFIATKTAAGVLATSGDLLFTCAPNTDIQGGRGNGTTYKASSSGRGRSVISVSLETNASTMVSDCACLKLGRNLAADVMMCTPGAADADDTPAEEARRAAAAATNAAAVATRAADAAAGTPEETEALRAAAAATSAATSATEAASAVTRAVTRAAEAVAALAAATRRARAATPGTPEAAAAAAAVIAASNASTAAEATKVSTTTAATNAAAAATEAATDAADAAAAATRVTAALTRAAAAASTGGGTGTGAGSDTVAGAGAGVARTAGSASDAASDAALPQRNDVRPEVTMSDTSYNAMILKQKSDLLTNIQKIFRNELLANRSTDSSVIDKTTSSSSDSSSTQQGKEFNKSSQKCDGSSDEDNYRCPKNPDGSCPPVPDMTQYIKKDSIPCWGCSVDY
jgi:hypothetical protein